MYIYTMEYLSAIKDEILPFATTQMNLENIMLHETSQQEKDKYHMISLISGIENMAQMNLSTKQTDSQRTEWWLPREGRQGGRTGSLGLVDANYYIQNGLETSLVVQWFRVRLLMQGVRVRSLVREPRSHMPRGQNNQNIKQKQYCNKFNKDLKKKQNG